MAIINGEGAPRVCGDDPRTVTTLMKIIKVLPAYAGMIPGTLVTKEYVKGCSPRMRG